MILGDVTTTDALVDEALELAEGLNRPLCYVQFNSFYNGLTGSIMRGLHVRLAARGVDSYCFWGRRHESIDSHMQCCATKPEDASMQTLSTAYLLGAEVIEKHFTLNKSLPGNDHYHSGDVEDFKRAVENFRFIDRILGSSEKTVLACEETPRREARRSLVLTRDMKAGEVIAKEDLMPKRPGTGIAPTYADVVIGRAVKGDLAEDTILTWEMI